MPESSTPQIALKKLQNLPQVKNKEYMKTCDIIARLARLSVRLEPSTEARKNLFEARCTGYLKRH